ncbi:MAG: imidazole glycerol phosphate synthase subunit HisH [Thermoleophilia bacterium]|nr:imidazole glycerol phosphate synthase subunit HisH [Thermoleophilia bacterium]
MIGVIDYQAGNAPSVLYALERLGLDARLVATPSDLQYVDRIILPGVGAARATIGSLEETDLIGALRDRVVIGATPFLGICIGLQILFDHSDEGDTDCLGWLAGNIRRFPNSQRVPQIGWNNVAFDRPHALVDGLDASPYFYFVNSYYAVPSDPEIVIGQCEYGIEFAAMVAEGNIAATQFHVEKSGEVGLRILSNFADWEPSC